MTFEASLAFVLLFGASVAIAADDDSSSSSNSNDGDSSSIMSGDPALACQMLICLSHPMGKDLAECAPPLKAYNDMKPKRRPNFLSLCPKVE